MNEAERSGTSGSALQTVEDQCVPFCLPSAALEFHRALLTNLPRAGLVKVDSKGRTEVVLDRLGRAAREGGCDVVKRQRVRPPLNMSLKLPYDQALTAILLVECRFKKKVLHLSKEGALELAKREYGLKTVPYWDWDAPRTREGYYSLPLLYSLLLVPAFTDACATFLWLVSLRVPRRDDLCDPPSDRVCALRRPALDGDQVANLQAGQEVCRRRPCGRPWPVARVQPQPELQLGCGWAGRERDEGLRLGAGKARVRYVPLSTSFLCSTVPGVPPPARD